MNKLRYENGKVNKRTILEAIQEQMEKFNWCRMKYPRWIERVVRITVRWVCAIIVIRPQTMNAKICCRLPSCGVATTLLCVTIWSWPLQKVKISNIDLIKKFLIAQIFHWNYILPAEQSRRNQSPEKHIEPRRSVAAAEA